jgi:hypothetical protein
VTSQWSRSTSLDTAGYQNTRGLRRAAADDPSKYPIAFVVDFENGWFVPAASQMRILYGHIPYINESFEIIEGSTPIPTPLNGMTERWQYWTSTQSTATAAHRLHWDGRINNNNQKNQIEKVRPMRYIRLDR